MYRETKDYINERPRRELSIKMVTDNNILKNNQITLSPGSSYLKQDYKRLPKTEVSFQCVEKIHKVSIFPRIACTLIYFDIYRDGIFMCQFPIRCDSLPWGWSLLIKHLWMSVHPTVPKLFRWSFTALKSPYIKAWCVESITTFFKREAALWIPVVFF